MHARLQTIRALPEPPVAETDRVTATIAAHPGFAGLYRFEQLGHRRVTLLTLWATEDDARLAPERTAAALGPRPFELEFDEVLLVDDDWAGASAAEPAGAASIVWFDGPLSDLRIEAARFAGRERLAPLMTRLPGQIRAISLWQQETRDHVVVTLARTIEDVERGASAVTATELLPGEDPALLPGADRVDLHRVTAQLLAPQAVTA